MTFVNELNQHGNMDMVGRCSSGQLKTTSKIGALRRAGAACERWCVSCPVYTTKSKTFFNGRQSNTQYTGIK